MTEREERLGRNEALFREVNERIEAIQESLRPDSPTAEFICECGNAACTEHITMTLPEYEQVRSDPTHFFVVPGHDAESVEQVVGRTNRYEIVRKRPGSLAELAARESPR